MTYEVPFSVVISEEEYERNRSNLAKYCMKGYDYLLLKSETPMTFIHYTHRKKLETILKDGILPIDEMEANSFGKGVYSYPTLTRRIWDKGEDIVGIVFQNPSYYYICIESRVNILPIQCAFFKEAIIPKQFITVLQGDEIASFLEQQPWTPEQLLYYTGLDDKEEQVLERVRNATDIFNELPYLLDEIRNGLL